MKELDGIRIVPEGDQAVLVEFENEISESCNRKVSLLKKHIEQETIEGIVETIPAFRSLLIFYNPMQVSYGQLKRKVKSLLKKSEKQESLEKTIIRIPVCYEEEFGIDMKQLCEHTGLNREEIIQIHTGNDYLIYMLGFLPGFPYLGGLDPRLEMSRLDNPRTSIPAGAVGIGGKQTGIYPLASPGGWRIIGQTPIRLYDSRRKKQVLYQAGDYIRFEAISSDRYHEIEQMVSEDSFDYTSLILS